MNACIRVCVCVCILWKSGVIPGNLLQVIMTYTQECQILGSMIVLQSTVIESEETETWEGWSARVFPSSRHLANVLHLWPIKHFSLSDYMLTKGLPRRKKKEKKTKASTYMTYFLRCWILALPARDTVFGRASRACRCSNEPEHLVCSAFPPLLLGGRENKVWHRSVIHFQLFGHERWISLICTAHPERTHT